jgi:hypothetical protein
MDTTNIISHKKTIINVIHVLIVVFSIITLIIISYTRITDTNGIFLVNEKGGIWIRYREPIILEIQSVTEITTLFQTVINVSDVPKEAYLFFKAYRTASVWIDKVCIYKGNTSLNNWNNLLCINLSPYLSPGHHTMFIRVNNIGGPPAVMASCKALRISTGEHWKASKDGRTWVNAISVEKVFPPNIYYEFQRSDTALFSNITIYLIIFIIIFLLIIVKNSINTPNNIQPIFSPAKLVKWLVLGLYAILAINNFLKLPIYMGMDHAGHLQYIKYIADNWRIPLVTKGWSMGEPPLFYIISAFIYRFSLNLFSLETLYRILRLIPLICGAVQIEICYRVLKVVYPTREDLQAFAIIVGGLLPVNIFTSQFLGTEPFAGCLSSVVILYAFKFINSKSEPKAGLFLSIGILLGLSLLSKITALLLIPPLILFIFITFYKRHPLVREYLLLTAKNSAIVLGAAFVLAGWYFIRNYYEFGLFIITNTSYSANSLGLFEWWQDPGYRTLSQLIFSGQALFHPVYSGLFSFWDALYSTFWADGWISGRTIYTLRPPWNYNFMLSSLWLSLLPFTTIIFGMISVFKSSSEAQRDSIIFATLCIAIFVAALFCQFILAPTFSMVKGKYMLGIIPCFAVLSAGGLDLIITKNNKFLRPIVFGLLICWASSVYLGYFVSKVPDEMKIIDHYKLADDLIIRGSLIEAAGHYLDIQRINPKEMSVEPTFIAALNKNMRIYASMGDDKNALNYLLILKDLQPENATHYYNIACIYAKQNRVEESIVWLKQSIDKGFHNWDLIKKDPDLANIRNTSFVNELFKNH